MSTLQKNTSKKTRLDNNFNEGIMLLFLCFFIETSIFFLACIGALLADVKSKNFFVLCLVSLCLGCFASGFISVRKIKKNGLLNGVLFSLPANIIYIFVSSALNSFSIDYFTIISFILLVFFSAAGGVVSVNFTPKSKIKLKR